MPTHTLTPEELFCLEGCRSYGQYCLMRSQFEQKVCTFCNIDRSVNAILWENEHAQCWAVPDAFLRTELKHHLIIAPKRHVRFMKELGAHEVEAIYIAHYFLETWFHLEGGIIATRFGDMRLNAGTIPHLHVNIMVPNGTGEVRIPAYKSTDGREANQTRAEGFAKRYEAGEVSS